MPESPIDALLIEDDDAYAEFIRATLPASSRNLEIRRARSFDDATALIVARPPEVVLLGLRLPDSSSLAAIERVHALGPDIAVIVLTTNGDHAMALQAMQRGADDYLQKGAADAYGLARAMRYARERAALRRQLREREARFRALVEYSSETVTLVDEHYVALYVSRSVERLSGYTPEEILGRRMDTLSHPDDQAEIDRRFGECLANPGVAYPLNLRYRHKDGTWHWGEAVVVNRLDDPAVQAIVVNLRDVTERKAAEQALRATEEQLRQAHKMEAIGRLAGGIAHDFNNVLTAIFGYADLLRDQFDPDDPRRDDLEEIRQSAERAATLTRQLLAFSRKQVMQPRVFDLNDVVRSLEKLIRRLVGGDITVALDLQEDLWEVRADPGQVEQVLMNLAANARDAMPQTGRIVIGTVNAPMSADQVEQLPGLAAGDYVCLSVSDTGDGIPEEIRERIFEPFFTTKEQGKGTGLGLATVYGIVKQTGGGIYVDSREGTGTRFRVYLPRVP